MVSWLPGRFSFWNGSVHYGGWWWGPPEEAYILTWNLKNVYELAFPHPHISYFVRGEGSKNICTQLFAHQSNSQQSMHTMLFRLLTVLLGHYTVINTHICSIFQYNHLAYQGIFPSTLKANSTLQVDYPHLHQVILQKGAAPNMQCPTWMCSWLSGLSANFCCKGTDNLISRWSKCL